MLEKFRANVLKTIKFLNILPSSSSHRIGKFNILSVNIILFQGNQKNIRFGLSNADSGLFTKQFERFLDYQIRETKSAISRHARMFS